MTQKQILIPVFLFLILFASCEQVINKSLGDKKNLDVNEISYIEIRNHYGGKDSVQTISKRLSSEQTKIFVDKFNNANPCGPYKYIVEYWVDVSLKDGTMRTYRVNSSKIKEDNDYCFDMGDINYLKDLWTTIK